MITVTPDADSIDGVLDRMDTIASELPASDGVATFNRMYAQVTRLIDRAVDHDSFGAGKFLERLDVHFANLFFDAYAADAAGRPVPAAWRPLFESRAKPGTEPIQFAFAGMNAHICHDLACAVVTTCRELAVAPEHGSPEYVDFTATNRVLEQAMDEVKGWFLTGLVARVDGAAGRLDDAFAMFGISTARAGAWETAELLWALTAHAHLDRAFRANLGRTVALASRGILL